MKTPKELSESEQLSQRKLHHIELTAQSQTPAELADPRFDYEPLLGRHPKPGERCPVTFLGQSFDAPLWVGSMTGGTELARKINHNLARAVADFKLGMGLGSCRPLLHSNERFEDFNLRPILGDRPLYANLGIAQLEQLALKKDFAPIHRLIDRLKADGLIIHLNPLQEWMQEEGDLLTQGPLATLQDFIPQAQYPLMVKEVGQGLGPRSLMALMELPLAAIEFAAFGGTNFSTLELMRRDNEAANTWHELTQVGHTAEQMVNHINHLWTSQTDRIRCREFIISGGVSSFLQGHYLIKKCVPNAIYGQASAFLAKAQGDYELLAKFIEAQIQGLVMAQQYLVLRS